MKNLNKYFLFFVLVLPLLSFSQRVSNIHFEQVGKQIHIYYNLAGDQEYTVQVFCSEDGGKTWGNELQKVSGAVGENQVAGNNKMIVWDVLAEREKLSGDILFKTVAVVSDNTFTDKRDGHKYKWVKIGTQVWMAENLNYETHTSWCYNNKTSNCDEYGRLYDWETAMKACPLGWHLPSDDEWKQLEIYLGMKQRWANKTDFRGIDEGKKLKSTSGWNSGGNGTDGVGFIALPGGHRFTYGSFNNLGYTGYWWSATEYSILSAWYRYLTYSYDKVRRFYYSKDLGFSVRCVKD